MTESSFIMDVPTQRLTLLYVQAREIKIPQDNNSADPSKAEQQIVTAMAVSPSEENLVVVTDASQLYQITLSSAELGKVSNNPIELQHLISSFSPNTPFLSLTTILVDSQPLQNHKRYTDMVDQSEQSHWTVSLVSCIAVSTRYLRSLSPLHLLSVP